MMLDLFVVLFVLGLVFFAGLTIGFFVGSLGHRPRMFDTALPDRYDQ